MTLQGILDDMFAGTFTVWYRDLLSLVRDKSRLLGTLMMTAIMLVGIGFGLGGLIGKVGATASGAMGAANIPGVPFVQFIFPTMIAITILGQALQSTMSIVWDREFGFMRQILVAPVSRTSVALGKVAGGITVAAVQGAILLVAAPLLGIQLTAVSVVLILAVMLMLAATVTSLGVLTAARQRSTQAFQFINVLVMMPMMMLSMASFLPSFGSGMMAKVFQLLEQLNPVSYGIDALRQLMLGSAMPANLVLHPVGVDMLVLGVLFVAFLVPGVRLFSKQD